MLKKQIKKFTPQVLHDARHLFFAWFGAVKYKHPSKELLVIGITGTSGKSTTVSFLRELLEASGHVVGSLSTVDFCIAGKSVLNDKKMTMLGHFQTQKFLRQMVDQGCTIAIVESTSQGVLQYRHRYIHFDVFGLTNLYHEHIEAHGGFEQYKNAKRKLFEYTSLLPQKTLNLRKVKRVAVVNGDIPEHKQFTQYTFDEVVLFGTKQSVDQLAYIYTDIEQTKKGVTFMLNGVKLESPEVNGIHNVANITCATALAIAAGIDKQIVYNAIKKLTAVPGRLEFIPSAKQHGFDVIVDYAFEPVAMEALYSTVIPLQYKRILHVLGATGGGRDKSRRAPLGRIAGNNATIVFVTNEDPYEEDPKQIMLDVEVGVIDAGMKKDQSYYMILDRKSAIEKAIELSEPGDLVLITGKGSEQGMCIEHDRIIPWDDRIEANKAIKKHYAKAKTT